MSVPADTFLVRIRRGALIWQDFHTARWPACLPPEAEHANEERFKRCTRYPDAVFKAVWKACPQGGYWDCRRDGYGAMRLKGDKGEYGNGSIFVPDEDGVEIIAGPLAGAEDQEEAHAHGQNE